MRHRSTPWKRLRILSANSPLPGWLLDVKWTPKGTPKSPEIHKKWDSLQNALDADPNADRGWFAVNSVMKSAGLRPLTENLDVPDNATTLFSTRLGYQSGF